MPLELDLKWEDAVLPHNHNRLEHNPFLLFIVFADLLLIYQNVNQ